MRRSSVIASVLVLGVAAAAVLIVHSVLPGFSKARGADSAAEAAETFVATYLLHASVPDEAKAQVNPLRDDAASVTVGRDTFREKCEVCHAYEGGGKTTIGGGEYPPAPPLKALNIQDMSDGEIFYHIRNGIRNTGMPAWSMPDRQIWQLVSYVRHLPIVATLNEEPRAASDETPAIPTGAHYVGSATCATCHKEIFERWKETRMANIIRDPKEHPDAIMPDFSKPNPLVTFTKDDIAFVYGSKWKQRFFKKVGDDYFPLPAQWDITNKKWSKYSVPMTGGDWWTPFYPASNDGRPTGPLCDGCHSVAYDIATKAVAEWNVGCERCHGAGSAHAAQPLRSNIVNPAKLNYVDASDTCIQCHSQGRPKAGAINGKYYDWPVGFDVGKHLSDFWKLEDHKLGETTFTHFADGTAHKNRMQGNDFVQSLMYARGVTCFSCHDPHGSPNNAMLRAPGNETCYACHGANSQNGPHAVSIEAHTHHPLNSPGSDCAACHMPKIAQTIANVNVSSHTFKFVTPAESEQLKIPNACNTCHADKSTAWATAALATWKDRSPWRMDP